MSVNPSTTVPINYKQIGGLANAGAKAHAAARQKFDLDGASSPPMNERAESKDSPPAKTVRVDISA